MEPLINFISVYWIDFVVGLTGVILGFLTIFLIKQLIKQYKANRDLKTKALTLSKITMVFLFAIMAVIALVAFFAGEPKYSISGGIICILGLMLFTVFSDSIEDFSIANLITLKKEIKTKDNEVSKLSSENTELRTQLTSIVSASIHNQNLNNVVLGFGDSFLKYARVEQVKEEETASATSVDASADTDLTNPTNNESSDRPSSSFLRTQFFRYAEPLLLSKYAALKEIPNEQVQKHVRFSNYLDTKDPIMEHRAVFNAYIKRPLEEVFIESAYLNANVNAYYRWYYMISLILQYAKTNQKSAKLVLLTPRLPPSVETQIFNGPFRRNLERDIERVRNNFQPAIQNGFLEIVVIDFTEDECLTIINTLLEKQSD